MRPPEPHLPFTISDLRGCWPMNVTKVELDDGHPVFEGEFDVEDISTVQRAFPGRTATIDDSGMIIHMSECSQKTCRRWN